MVWLNFLDMLTVKCHADQLWPKPISPVFEKCKTTVKVSAAHSDAIEVPVKSDERSYDEIQIFCRNLCAADRLPKSKTISLEKSLGP